MDNQLSPAAAEILGHLTARAAALPGFHSLRLARDPQYLTVSLEVRTPNGNRTASCQLSLVLLDSFRLGKVKDVAHVLFESQLACQLDLGKEAAGGEERQTCEPGDGGV